MLWILLALTTYFMVGINNIQHINSLDSIGLDKVQTYDRLYDEVKLENVNLKLYLLYDSL